jgi:PmbA protein
LAFVVSSNFNFKTYSEKKSCFSEKENEFIAKENLSLIDNPHLPQGIGSKPFDDEGVQTKINTIIDKGKFVNTFSNLFDSFKENSESTGNASRAGSPMGRSSEPIPTSLPHNMEIPAGEISREEMIRETKRGLIVGRLWYTYAVNPIIGDFSCTARSGIKLIENGKIINSVKPVRIIHNLQKFLKDISAIGNDKKNVIQWASTPSSTPAIKVEKIHVDAIS